MTFFVLLYLAASLPGYVISTVAGGDNVGDNGLASQAYFGILEGVAAAPDGTVYLADADDHRIRRISPFGIVQTFAGTGVPGFSGDGGPAAQANLNAPYGLALSRDGYLYVADLGNGRVRRIDPDGTISSVASGLASPRNVAIDPSGNVYVSEFSGHRVSRINPDGSTTVVAGTGASGSDGQYWDATNMQLSYPAGIAFDAQGQLYIADSNNNRIRMVSGGWIYDLQYRAKFPLRTPTDVTVDAAGNLYVAHAGIPAVFKRDSGGVVTALPGSGRALAMGANGSLLIAGGQHLQQVLSSGDLFTLFGSTVHNFGDGGPATLAHLGDPGGLAQLPGGVLAISDTAANRLRAVAADGAISTMAASQYVNRPRDLLNDADGDLFIADSGDHRVRELLASGTMVTLGANASTGPAVAAPGAMARDAAGNLYLIDGQVVRRIDAHGGITTVAGTGNAGHQIGGSRAIDQDLNQPSGLALDSLGRLLIADTRNGVVRRLEPDGTLTTLALAGTTAPVGLLYDSSGNLWVSDQATNQIRAYFADGASQLVAGAGGAGYFAGDGGAAVSARLFSPGAMTAARDGSVYFVDRGNRRIRKLTPGVLAPPELQSGLQAVNAASFRPGPLAPGSLVTIFGSGLQDGQPYFDNLPAPVFYSADGQINTQLPYAASPPSTLLEVRHGATVASLQIAVTAVAPALFLGAGNSVLATTPDGLALPLGVTRGSVIVLYGTGLGQTQPPAVTGQPAPAAVPCPAGSATLTIGGVPADILYCGLSPGLTGVFQINARVPDSPSGTVPLDFSIGTARGPAGTVITVQ